ncbi:MAG: protein kinase [Isosphaerales bacterium]
MIPEHDLPVTEESESEVEALLAFDRALAAGNDPSASVEGASFLQGVHECQRLLEAVWPRSVQPSLEVPRQFGRFSIVRELGRGGFGVVFLAVDSVLRRQVALKVPRPEVLVTPEVRRRFLREAEAASRLDHPHIVPVYEVGEEGPICYIASAYCEGLTLAEWLRRRTASVPILTAARLVAILAAAVAHAHQRGILHRDLKPGNILLQRLDASVPANAGECQVLGFLPRICDFGLAKLLDQVSQETCSGVAIGSSSYMAPEQAAGRLREHGPATDVYALGVILYELLTGRPPLRGETDLETLRLVSDQDPPAPRDLRPGLARDLETITLKCLEKRPNRRYATAPELTEDLQQFLNGKPVHARPVPAWDRAGKWARRRPVHATLAVVIVLAMVSIVGVLLWSGAWLRRHNQKLRETVARAERDMQLAERSAQDARIEIARGEEREQFGQRYGLATQVKLLHETFESGNVALAAKMLNALRPAPGWPEPRGFAWGYVRQLFRPEVTLLGKAKPLKHPVLKLAVSSDNRTIAAGMSDGRVVLWDVMEEHVLHSLRHQGSGAGGEVYFLAFSRDGRLLASGSPNNSVKLWDVATGGERATLPTVPDGEARQIGDLFALRFTDNSGCLVTVRRGVRPQTFRVLFWSVPAAGGQPRLHATLDKNQLPRFGREGRLQGPSWPRADEAAAPWLSYARDHLILLDDGASLAIKEEATGVTLLEPLYYIPVARICGPFYIPALYERPVTSLSPDEIAQFSGQARRVVGSAQGGDRRAIGPYGMLAFSPDGLTLAAFQGPLGVTLSDVASGRTWTTYALEPYWRVVDLIYTPDGQTLVMAGFHPQIHVWRVGPHAVAGHKKEVWGLVFSPDGKSLASAADDHTIKLWEVASGRERATLKGHGSLVTAVANSPDGALLASAGFDKTIRLWDAASGDQIATLRGHTDHVRTVAFSPDGKTLASGGDDREIRLWEAATGRELRPPLTGHTKTVFSVAFAPDGNTLYSGAGDKTIRLWDWQEGRFRAAWPADDQVYSLAVSPDGQTLAVAHLGGKVTLWEVAQQKARPPLRGHVDDVLGIAFSPDGLTLASAGRDQTVRLWDPVTAQELLTLKGHEAPVHAVAFSPGGTILATGSHDGAIKLWRASPGSTDQKTIASMPKLPNVVQQGPAWERRP